MTDTIEASDAQPVPSKPPQRTRGGAGPRKRIRRRWWVLGGAVVFIVAAVAAYQLLRPANRAGTGSRTITMPATVTDETVLVNLTGTLAPQQQADLSFASAGTVTSVRVKVGDKVSSGDELATIDDTQLRNAVALAKANVTAAQASYDSVAATSGVTNAQLASAKAQVSSAKAKLTSARSALVDATLTTPIDGTVASVDIAAGDHASGASGTTGAGSTSSSSTAQIVVISPTSWLANATVGPADIGSLKAGQHVTATVDGATATATGKVTSVGVVATTSGGSTTFPVVVKLVGNPKGFYDGVSVSLAITTGSYAGVLTVPTLALTTSNDTTTVSKVAGSEVVTTKVETGRTFGDRTEITSGLAEGDQVQITSRFAPPGASASAGSGFPGMRGGPAGGSGGQGTGPGAGGAPPDPPAGGGNGG